MEVCAEAVRRDVHVDEATCNHATRLFYAYVNTSHGYEVRTRLSVLAALSPLVLTTVLVCFGISFKYHMPYDAFMHPADIASVVGCSKAHVLQREADVLHALDWRVSSFDVLR